jgi:hypothetical protein
MSEYAIRPLCSETWDAFAALAAKHNGVWGDCWCTWFHTFHGEKEHTAEGYRPQGAAGQRGTHPLLRWCLTVMPRSPGASMKARMSC